MRKTWISTALVIAFTLTSHAELVENGNFSNNLSNWDLACPDAYGPVPKVEIRNRVLRFEQLHETSAGYMTLNQAVRIEEGKVYRITFEAQGTGTQQYLVAVHDPGELGHVAKLFTPSASWETQTIDFKGVFETDKNWVRDWLRATRSAKLRDGRTVNTSLHKVRDPKGDGPSRSWITFGLGALSGSFEIRNISLVEVE